MQKKYVVTIKFNIITSYLYYILIRLISKPSVMVETQKVPYKNIFVWERNMNRILDILSKVVPKKGLEPPTHGLEGHRSTPIELLRHI